MESYDCVAPLVGSSDRYIAKTSQFLKSYFEARDGRITVLKDTPRYLELVVRNLKGQVIHGGNQWERLTLIVSITDIDRNKEEIMATM
jgi:hypothetical protein